MKVGDKVLYCVSSHINRPFRVGTVIEITTYKNGAVFYIIRSLTKDRTLSRRQENVHTLNSIDELIKSIIGAKNAN